MKHELVQARDATGMQLRGQNDLLCGYYRGYAMLTVMNSKNRSYDIVVWASRPGCDMAPQLDQWMADYAARNPVCTAGTYNGQLLTARVAMDKKRDITAQSLISFYKEVTGWLAANGMVSVCDQCGAADTSLYHIGRGYNVVCPRCLDQMTQAAKAQQKEIPGNLPAGIVGAMLFSLAGVALWVLVYQLGYIAAICGLVLMVCSFKGYEKFGKKLDMAGIAASVLVAVFMALVSQYICVGLDIYEVFQEYGIGILESLRAVPDFLFDPELELLGAYAPDLLMGFVFMAVGSFSFIRNAVAAQKHGGFAVEKMAQGPAAAAAAPAPAPAVNHYGANTYNEK